MGGSQSFQNKKPRFKKEGTFGDGLLNEFLFSECGSLEHFLETDDIKLVHNLQKIIESFVFEIIIVGFDGRRPQEQVESEELDRFGRFGHDF